LFGFFFHGEGRRASLELHSNWPVRYPSLETKDGKGQAHPPTHTTATKRRVYIAHSQSYGPLKNNPSPPTHHHSCCAVNDSATYTDDSFTHLHAVDVATVIRKNTVVCLLTANQVTYFYASVICLPARVYNGHVRITTGIDDKRVYTSKG
jgi:hypothetical protein